MRVTTVDGNCVLLLFKCVDIFQLFDLFHAEKNNWQCFHFLLKIFLFVNISMLAITKDIAAT